MTNTTTNTINNWFSQADAATEKTKARHNKFVQTAIATAYVLYSGENYYNGDKAVKDVNNAARFESIAAAEKDKAGFNGTCYCQIAKVCQTPDGEWHDVWAADDNVAAQQPTDRRVKNANAKNGHAINVIYNYQIGSIYQGGFVGPKNGLLRGRRNTDERMVNKQGDTVRDIIIFDNFLDAENFCQNNQSDMPEWAYAPHIYKVKKYATK